MSMTFRTGWECFRCGLRGDGGPEELEEHLWACRQESVSGKGAITIRLSQDQMEWAKELAKEAWKAGDASGRDQIHLATGVITESSAAFLTFDNWWAAKLKDWKR